MFIGMTTTPVKPLGPFIKTGIVLGGFAAAFAVAWAIVIAGQFSDPTDPSAGMRAFGDLILGLAIFGVLAIVPFGLGLYWLAVALGGNPTGKPAMERV